MNGNKPEVKIVDGETLKKCNKCGEFQSLKNYYSNKRYFLGSQHYCKNCFSKWAKIRNTKEKNKISNINRYGLELEQYELLAEYQKGKCAICDEETKLVIDHSHDTKHIRGLLCADCNFGLGRFKDNIRILEKAILYLKIRNL